MKKILSVLALFIPLFITIAFCIPAVASANTISISLDGVPISFPDAHPFIDENDRTQVPIAALAQLLNVETEWDGETNTAYIKKEGSIIKITIGDNKIYLGDAEIVMDSIAIIVDNRTFVPLRYVAQAFDFSIEWSEGANSVNLVTPNSEKSEGNPFDFALLDTMPDDRNYVISPFSLKMALAMAANGADGTTKQEILDALSITDLEQFNKYTMDFIASSNKNKSVEINIANSIWYNIDYYKDEILDFSDIYKNIIRDYYSGNASKINNANGAKIINDWIDSQTNGKINDVIDDEIAKQCLFFLVNTIYFKGEWAVPFKAEATINGIFTDREGNEKTTDFMTDGGDYLYFENTDFQILAKPYKDNNIQMYFVLCKNDKSMTMEAFDNAVNNMTPKYVYLNIPKFKTEYLHENLIEILKAIGITAAFDADNADFLNMYSEISSENAYINLILQKTFIEVDEKGTEAAAASVLGGMRSAPPEFICDRPFIYFVRNDSTGEILFIGEYAFVE